MQRRAQQQRNNPNFRPLGNDAAAGLLGLQPAPKGPLSADGAAPRLHQRQPDVGAGALRTGELQLPSPPCSPLLQDNVDIDHADKNGKTPLLLAKGRKHDKIVHYLTKQAKVRNSILPRLDFWCVLFCKQYFTHYGLFIALSIT